MYKVLKVGTIQSWGGRWGYIRIEVEVKDGELSISGEKWGSGGQIDMEFQHRNRAQNDRRTNHLIQPKEIRFAPGWNSTKWLDLLDVWAKYHLNHMNPGCEHMTGPEWDSSKTLTLYYYRTKKHVRETRDNYMDRAKLVLQNGGILEPTLEESRLACLPDELTLAWPELCPELAQDYEPNGPHYQGDHYNKASEEKTAGWVLPENHPEGLLTKPCPVCGYKYGTAWRKRELPQSVIDFLAGLPDADSEGADDMQLPEKICQDGSIAI